MGSTYWRGPRHQCRQGFALDHSGQIVAQESFDYDLIQKQFGYNEQNPEDWFLGRPWPSCA